MQVTIFQQFLSYPLLYTLNSKAAIGQYYTSPATLFQQVYHQYQKQVGTFFCPLALRKIGFIAIGYNATEWRIGKYDIQWFGRFLNFEFIRRLNWRLFAPKFMSIPISRSYASR